MCAKTILINPKALPLQQFKTKSAGTVTFHRLAESYTNNPCHYCSVALKSDCVNLGCYHGKQSDQSFGFYVSLLNQ